MGRRRRQLNGQDRWHPEIDPEQCAVARRGRTFSSGNLVGGEVGEAPGYWEVRLVTMLETVTHVYNYI